MENISKRDHFAMVAMGQIMALYPSRKEVDVAITSYIYADAMVAESEKQADKKEDNNEQTKLN